MATSRGNRLWENKLLDTVCVVAGSISATQMSFSCVIFHLCAGWSQSSVCSQRASPHRGSGPSSPGRS